MRQAAQLASLLTLMDDIAGEDFLDFADVPLDESEAKRLVGQALLKSQQELHKLNLSPEQRELSLLAAAGHLVLENLLLNIRMLTAGGVDAASSAQALMDKLRKP